MVSVFLIWIQISICYLVINASKQFRRPCLKSSEFPCDNGYCIKKHRWCDSSDTCSDRSDEVYCRVRYSAYGHYSNPTCDEKIHFRCKNERMCIPIEGYCDGYSSCSDLSDEIDCPCEELHESERSMRYESSIGEYNTQQKCWKVLVKEGQRIDVNIQARLHHRDCKLGNITLTTELNNADVSPSYEYYSYETEENKKPYEYTICPTDGANHNYNFTRGMTIRYRSNWYTSEADLIDIFVISYRKGDLTCLIPESFKCSSNICLLPEKRCNGIKDCENGLDEQNCNFTAISAVHLKNDRDNVSLWMRNQHNADWGWKVNTNRAIVALYLSNYLNANVSSNEYDLFAKQLELELSASLLRRKTDKISPTELSAYINALLVICHNPRNFFGFDLISYLKEEMENISEYGAPLPYLTLCSAGEYIHEGAVNRLLQTLKSSSDNGFVLEIQALASIALSCISNNNQYEHLKQNITEALNDLKKEQKEDGSFGNEYTTALVLQALIANDQANDRNWNFESFNSSIEFLLQKQNADGSFGDFLTTYLVMPILNGKSLLDVGKVNCTESLKRPKEGNLISDIKSRLGKKIPVKYSLFIGDEMDQIHPIVLRTPANITVLELMELAACIDPKYKFKTHQIKEKIYVYEISGIPNDPENNKFWFFYREVKNGTEPISTQSPDEIRVNDNDHIITWYKSLNII